MRRASLLLLPLLLLGCKASLTELVLSVNQVGLAIGTQIDHVNIEAYDTTGGTMMPDNSADLLLCSSTVTTSCSNFPITATLIPGSGKPSDTVRVTVLGEQTLGDGSIVPKIADAATFTFTHGVSLRLDITLYARCYGRVDCADIDNVCDVLGNCVAISPEPITQLPDLAGPAVDGGVDAANPPDQGGADLLRCCTNRVCVPDPTCGNISCGSCSNSLTMCDSTGQCSPCGAVNEPCCGSSCPTSGTCNGGGICSTGTTCGGASQPCCGALCDNGYACVENTCTLCGVSGKPCCAASDPGGECSGTTLVCDSTNTCSPCGDGSKAQACCPSSTPCNAPFDYACDDTNHCSACGTSSLQCCSGAADYCASTLVCGGDATCDPCGGQDQACCADGMCNSSFVCGGPTCVPCGGPGDLCCESQPPCTPGYFCGQGHCQMNFLMDMSIPMCGMSGQPCCAGVCTSGNPCIVPPGVCTCSPASCGDIGDMACLGMSCSSST